MVPFGVFGNETYVCVPSWLPSRGTMIDRRFSICILSASDLVSNAQRESRRIKGLETSGKKFRFPVLFNQQFKGVV